MPMQTPYDDMLRTAAALLDAMDKFKPVIIDFIENGPSPDEELWVKQYGECVPITKAARILGCGIAKINGLLERGDITATPDKKIHVSSLARWAYLKKKRAAPLPRQFRVSAR